jgi:hypothetical protein
MSYIPFELTNWNNIEKVLHQGITGTAVSQTVQYAGLRIRLLEFSSAYLADHWCQKGHIIYCIEGEMDTELADGQVFTLRKGMSYQVSDDLSSHRTSSVAGVKLFIVDGDFLK